MKNKTTQGLGNKSLLSLFPKAHDSLKINNVPRTSSNRLKNNFVFAKCNSIDN